MSAQLHIITGKGGVGKSTFAAALTHYLSENGEGPVLLIEVQGSGRSLELLGMNKRPFENTSLPLTTQAWGARILPRESFKQYFSTLLSLGNDESPFAQLTSVLRNRVVDVIMENRVVSAFVDVCPGLEPSVLLGKIHWEATLGRSPETYIPWRHVVVDAPATGHGLMLFRSTAALTQVFGSGTILKQASAIMKFVRDPKSTKVYVVTTLEELPIKETLEIKRQLSELEMPTYRFIINRSSTFAEPESLGTKKIPDPIWQQEVEFEKESLTEQQELLSEFKTSEGNSTPLLFLSETPSEDLTKMVPVLSEQIGEQNL